MLLNLMAPHELKEAIVYLRIKLVEFATARGLSDKRTIEISQRLDKYLARYHALTKIN